VTDLADQKEKESLRQIRRRGEVKSSQQHPQHLEGEFKGFFKGEEVISNVSISREKSRFDIPDRIRPGKRRDE